MVVKKESSHRQRQAEATKQQITQAARGLFAERGYVATTISAISEEADIPVPTIYSALGTKANILARITETWMTEARSVSIANASLRETDPSKQLEMLAELNRRQLKVDYDVIGIYQEAARSDVQMTETLRNILAAREREIRKLVKSIAGRLKPGLTIDSALDITLALTLPEIYQTLVAERGWTGQPTKDGSPSPSSTNCSAQRTGPTTILRAAWASARRGGRTIPAGRLDAACPHGGFAPYPDRHKSPVPSVTLRAPSLARHWCLFDYDLRRIDLEEMTVRSSAMSGSSPWSGPSTGV